MPRFAVQTWALGLGYVAPSVHRGAPNAVSSETSTLGGSSEPTQSPRRPSPFARLEALVVALLREQHASEPANRAAELSHDINHKRPARLPNDRFGDHGGATRVIATATELSSRSGPTRAAADDRIRPRSSRHRPANETPPSPLKRLSPTRLLTARDEQVSKRTTVSASSARRAGFRSTPPLRRPAYGFRRTIPGGLSQGSNYVSNGKVA